MILTGHLGAVMKESAQAALSYARARAGQLDIAEDFFSVTDLHIHVPEGAIPKDGPSAGITMATAMISVFSDRPVRRDVAMTGEITLRGHVLPVGGLKEKGRAARRSGIRTVILPEANRKNLDEIPKSLRRNMSFVYVRDVQEVFAAALLDSVEADSVAARRGRRRPRSVQPSH